MFVAMEEIDNQIKKYEEYKNNVDWRYVMKKNEFKLNENVELIIYSYDDNGTEYTRNITGKICQITPSFIVIDNGKYKESFKYCELYSQQNKVMKGEPYDLSIDNYKEDIVLQCLNDINRKGKGFVFTKEQAEEVKSHLKNGKFISRKSDKTIVIEKI